VINVDKSKAKKQFEKFKNNLTNRKYLPVYLIGAIAVLLILALVYTQVSYASEAVEPKVDSEPKLTSYQKQYVDCPPKYLEFCTELSKMPTERVVFNRTENGKIFLDMGEGGSMVARLPTNSSEGYLISIEE